MVADRTVGSLILLTGVIGRCLRWALPPSHSLIFGIAAVYCFVTSDRFLACIL
ncbi:MAG: hypothetical protein HWQ38_02430 [Nostoc sp. NMS7]|uniref:hypothetical protein n=1 Tax=Nostoc sp. NMS7 TaxID=2815391 RepID=UPI0025CC2135|nr:hypothetical protein [Nostoc sp. NMS7]MBN3945396.1 hypothetical protein [Nostoc sp. NMS7]